MRALNRALSFGLLVLGGCGAITDLDEFADDDWGIAGTNEAASGGIGGWAPGKGGHKSGGGANAAGKGAGKAGASGETSGANGGFGGHAGKSGGGMGGSAGNSAGSGGHATGGQAGGVSGIGGSPGGAPSFAGNAGSPVAGAPSDPPPEGCTVASAWESTDHCTYNLECESSYISASCQESEGRWFCDCSVNRFAKYVVEDSDGPPCHALGSICIAPPEFVGPEKCELEFDWTSGAQCARHYQCTRALSGTPNISKIVRVEDIACFQDESHGSVCGCNGQEFRVQGVDGTSSCDLSRSLCATSLDYDAPVCTTNSGSTQEGQYCDASAQCLENVQLSDGVNAQRLSARSSECVKNPDSETSTCTCYMPEGLISFDLAAGPELATCHRSLESCASPELLELTSPAECKVTQQDVDQFYCYSSFTCSRTGKLGDWPAKALGGVTTNCQVEGDSWSCLCANGYRQEFLRFLRQGNAWDNCTAMSERCREHVGDPFESASTE